jgi:isochorismate hydrolase
LKPIVVREAVQDRSEILHEFTLFDLQSRFADVVGLENAMDYLRGL